MAVNSTEVSWGFGQMGSIHVAGTNAVTVIGGRDSDSTPASNVNRITKVFVAITFLEDTTFNNSLAGLTPENSSNMFPGGTGMVSAGIDAGALNFEVKSTWVDLLQLVLITVIGAYFGGRSLEKVKK